MAVRGLLKSTGLVSFFTLVSRILGLVRDMIVAQIFGATDAADAFFVAFKIPNFLRRLFAEGAFAQAFVPVLSEYKTLRSHGEVKMLVDRVAGDLGIILIALSIAASLLAPWVVMVFAPGFSQMENKLDLAAEMLRFTFPYLLFISLTAFAGSVLNTYKHFAAPAIAPVVLNLCMIGGTLWISPLLDEPIMALAWAVLAAGFLQMLLQLPFMAKHGLMPRPRLDWHHEGVRRILKLMLPALFGVSVSQINLLLDTVLASFLVSGSVSWLYYSDRLMELPLGLFGIAIGTVILPSLSQKFADKSHQDFSDTLDWALRFVLLMGIPAAMALFVLAEPIIATLFMYNEFAEFDVVMTSWSLRAYSLGIIAFLLIKVLSPGYFSRQDTKTPVKIGVKAMVVNMVFNLILIWHLKHAGLALATSLAAGVNAFLLFRGLRKAEVFVPRKGWLIFLGQIGLATTVMCGALWWLRPELSVFYGFSSMDRMLWISGLVGAGVVAYFLVLLATGMRPDRLLKGH